MCIHPLRAKKALVATSVSEDPLSRPRLDAMLQSIEAQVVEHVDDRELEEALRPLGPRSELARGGLEGREREKELIAFGSLASDEVFPGYEVAERRDGALQAKSHGVLCHSAIELQSAVGCPFDCSYCPYSSFVCLRMDVERFVDRAAAVAMEKKGQGLFKLNNRTDTLALEPEYGLARKLVERFAHLPGKYLMLYSKGIAVDHLLDADHRGKTIACMTLTPDQAAAHLEKGAPPPAARIEALAKLARAGYPTRVRFSPMVPIKNWEEAYGQLIEQLAGQAMPEMVTLWTLSMVQATDLSRIVPLDELDAHALELAMAEAGQMKDKKGAPFPPRLRAHMYRRVAEMLARACPKTKVSLCLETSQVWTAVGERVVPRSGARFLCNCGPKAVPAQEAPSSSR